MMKKDGLTERERKRNNSKFIPNFLIWRNNSDRSLSYYVKAADANLITSSLSPPFPLPSLSRASLSPDFSRDERRKRRKKGGLREERIIHSRSSYPRFSRGGAARYFQSTFKFTIVHRGQGGRRRRRREGGRREREQRETYYSRDEDLLRNALKVDKSTRLSRVSYFCRAGTRRHRRL